MNVNNRSRGNDFPSLKIKGKWFPLSRGNDFTCQGEMISPNIIDNIIERYKCDLKEGLYVSVL